jgi:glycosyltransferase involved in cell wall biosynthesis
VISFVVPAFNEERLLGRTLAAIHTAARELGRPYELIVADDASTDRTASVAHEHGARVVAAQFRQIARVRNAGAAAAAGDILIFVDADTIVPPATLRATAAALDGGAVGGGASVYIDGRLPLWVRLLMPPFRVAFRRGRLAAGCYVFSRRSEFLAVGGFDEQLYAAEELALSRALGRLGRFIVLREPVMTSGRKARTHTSWEVVRLLLGLLRHGPSVLKTREGLTLWYGERRDDL